MRQRARFRLYPDEVSRELVFGLLKGTVSRDGYRFPKAQKYKACRIKLIGYGVTLLMDQRRLACAVGLVVWRDDIVSRRGVHKALRYGAAWLLVLDKVTRDAEQPFAMLRRVVDPHQPG